MEPRTRKKLLFFLLVLCLLLAIPAWFAYRLGIIPRIDHSETFHAPVFGPDGTDVYYLTRDAWSISWGPGIEHFTSPASVVLLRDRFRLQRTDRETGRTTTIQAWRVPHPVKPAARYRNHLFGSPDCELQWEGRTLHYKMGLDIFPNDPPNLSVNEWMIGSWNAETNTLSVRELWKPGYHSANRWTRQILSGPWEIVDYKSKALILYDSGARTRTVLRVSRSAGMDFQEEAAAADLQDHTGREQLERSRTIQDAYAAAVAGFRAQGLPEVDAMLRANDEMEELGYYPRTPRLLAVKITAARQGVAVFEISNDEFTFGLFPDIEAAIARPGVKVHYHGGYLTHRDFDTSRRLNEYLEAGNRTFIVKTAKGMYLLSIT